MDTFDSTGYVPIRNTDIVNNPNLKQISTTATQAQIAALLKADQERLDDALATYTPVKAYHDHLLAGVDVVPGMKAVSQLAANDLAASHLPTLQAAEDKVTKAAAIAQANVNQIRAALADAPPTLTEKEQEQAAAKATMFQAEATALPLKDLKARVVRDTRADDRVAAYLWASFVPARLAAEGETEDTDTLADRATLRTCVANALDKLADPSVVALRVKAVKAGSAAAKAETLAGKREQAEVRYSFQTAGDVPWTEPD